MNLLAFNVPRTTRKPVLESQNRYAALSIEGTDDNDNDLCPWDDGHNAGDTVAAMGGPSRWESGGGDPGSQGTTQALKSKQSSPPSLGPVQENLKGLSQSPARAQAKAVKPAGHGAESLPEDDNNASTLHVMAEDPHTRAVPSPETGIKNGPPILKGTGVRPCLTRDQ
ncbi:hypothetical protein ARMSODRAFT_1021387 [Armillaria solidipes]|uniref:Uncharacterized protein n=1 Tax=Armillaria solidipes TaxID=1076256 RepID=A0A2H3B6Q2_9AGAR|nr:hypothetical protein ARMSODRAFT_1021387 [Armillaria solidipes]